MQSAKIQMFLEKCRNLTVPQQNEYLQYVNILLDKQKAQKQK